MYTLLMYSIHTALFLLLEVIEGTLGKTYGLLVCVVHILRLLLQ